MTAPPGDGHVQGAALSGGARGAGCDLGQGRLRAEHLHLTDGFIGSKLDRGEPRKGRTYAVEAAQRATCRSPGQSRSRRGRPDRAARKRDLGAASASRRVSIRLGTELAQRGSEDST